MTTVTTAAAQSAPREILNRFDAVRRRTLALCDPLSAEDMMVQSCPEASPVKWHLAHTSWFFESFVLREFLPDHREFNSNFSWLFNSYYQTFSAFPVKSLRSSFSRPGLDDVLHYRGYVDAAIERLIESDPPPDALRAIELGLNHEQQHQELLLTDVLHAFFTNPLRPVYRPWNESEDAAPPNSGGAGLPQSQPGALLPLEYDEFEGGLREIGSGDGFCFDNELPRHRVWLEHFSIARRLVTCAEYAAFIADGGYSRPDLWLSAGWDAVNANGWVAPLYWTKPKPAQESAQEGAEKAEEAGWRIFTLRGELPLETLAKCPVSHVSFFEADAYARWASKRLPTEFEWEAVAEGRSGAGNFVDSGRLIPAPAPEQSGDSFAYDGPAQQFGDCWEWTASAYLGYPGFRALPGSLGEYNGKFMSNQMVLRGGSCATPDGHVRTSYRNFFPPETRWQFSGIRLAF